MKVGSGVAAYPGVGGGGGMFGYACRNSDCCKRIWVSVHGVDLFLMVRSWKHYV